MCNVNTMRTCHIRFMVRVMRNSFKIQFNFSINIYKCPNLAKVHILRTAFARFFKRYNYFMRFTTLFIDLDDTLYPSSTGLWHAIKERMNLFMRERLYIPEAEIPSLREQYFNTYGTTLRGLQEH